MVRGRRGGGCSYIKEIVALSTDLWTIEATYHMYLDIYIFFFTDATTIDGNK